MSSFFNDAVAAPRPNRPRSASVEGLRREVREETGLDVTSCTFFGTFSNPSRVVAYGDGSVFQLVSIAHSVRVASTSGLRVKSIELRFFARSEPG